MSRNRRSSVWSSPAGELIHIPPVSMIKEYIREYQPQAFMALTHLVLKHQEYRQALQDYSGYIILDNSLIENSGEAMDLMDVITAAELIDADEIILPDVFRESEDTLRAVNAAIEAISEMYLLGKYKLMAVAQGDSISKWVACFERLERIPEVDIIGVPKVLAKLHPAGRGVVENIWAASKKDIHLLGLWYGLEELQNFRKSFRSMDTVMGTFVHQHDLHARGIRPDGMSIDLEAPISKESTWIQSLMNFHDTYNMILR